MRIYFLLHVFGGLALSMISSLIAGPSADTDLLPPFSNQRGSFRGVIAHEGLEGHTWVTFPFVENPASLTFDTQGRLYVAEVNRLWRGVPDLRGANELIRGDFQAVTVEDRLELYKSSNLSEDWFTDYADRVVRLEDRDGNGAADHRTVFSDRFNRAEDGLGFSLLADEGSVFFTCIPSVWRLRDLDGDGRADEEEEIVKGFGVRVSFIGHDLHGIIRGPDGRLYFSVGDRGYHLVDGAGKTHEGGGIGAVFRCESDGTGLEVLSTGLRNPQDLAFDDHGNLFTFDNTGDIGDKARMVYVLEGTDSGWNMAHQSAHHYAPHLDWGAFRPEQSMWVKEGMFDLYSEEQAQWVYPPAAHVAHGPSGITWLTGESLPEDLRDQFLITDYRGASQNTKALLIKTASQGAGFIVSEARELVRGVGASDVELSYDGKIYLCDFGGGWGVNENGSIQVIAPKDGEMQAKGAAVAALFKEGFEGRSGDELRELLAHPDRRVRQAAQFALVARGAAGQEILSAVVREGEGLFPRLHAIWGLGQLGREGMEVGPVLLPLLKDSEEEVRANAARVLGDLRLATAKSALLSHLAEDASLRVRSLAAIALGRLAKEGDPEVVEALFAAVRHNGERGPDIVLRHALLTALSQVAGETEAVAKVASSSREERLLAVLVLRRLESAALEAFLGDKDPLVLREVIRAIYDTKALDSPAGEALAAFDERLAELPESLQRRIVAANYRQGRPENAQVMLSLAAREDLALPVRKAALNGLKQWAPVIVTDPVSGNYRPSLSEETRSFDALSQAIGQGVQKFLSEAHDPTLITLAMELATLTKLDLDPATLLAQAVNTDLAPEVRVAVLEGLLVKKPEGLREVIAKLLEDSPVPVRAEAMKAAFLVDLEGIDQIAQSAMEKAPLPVARAAIQGMATRAPESLVALWGERETRLRAGLFLDLYLALVEMKHTEAASYAESDPMAVFLLGLHGGDPAAGEIVFKNQGACLQCHKVGGQGGEKGGDQGPDLREVAKRLSREKILESVADPGAEIAVGYGMTTVSLSNGDSVVGRLAEENEKEILIVGLDNSQRRILRTEIKALAPPVSAMPPLAATMPPREFRDLIAFLATQGLDQEKAKKVSAEEITK